jgi:hypothetical protein
MLLPKSVLIGLEFSNIPSIHLNPVLNIIRFLYFIKDWRSNIHQLNCNPSSAFNKTILNNLNNMTQVLNIVYWLYLY